MATYKNHVILSSVEDNGDVNELYPRTDASDVNVQSIHSSSIRTLQNLADKLGSTSFANIKDSILYIDEKDENPRAVESDIDDDIISKDKSWSSNKIKGYISHDATLVYNHIGNENNINNFLSKYPYIISINTSSFTKKPYVEASLSDTSTQLIAYSGNFIVEYIPFVRGKLISALQRWTYISKIDSSVEYPVVFARIYKNNTWSDFHLINGNHLVTFTDRNK